MNIVELENRISASLETVDYDITTCITLLREYNLKKAEPNLPLIHRILLRSVASFDTNDTDIILCQVPGLITNSDVESILSLETLLQGGSFPQFWEEWKKILAGEGNCTNTAKSVPKFEEAVRRAIGDVLSRAVVSLSCANATAALNTDDIAKALTMQKATISNDMVMFPLNICNSPKIEDKYRHVNLMSLAVL